MLLNDAGTLPQVGGPLREPLNSLPIRGPSDVEIYRCSDNDFTRQPNVLLPHAVVHILRWIVHGLFYIQAKRCVNPRMRLARLECRVTILR